MGTDPELGADSEPTAHGRVVRYLNGGNSMALFEFLKANRENFAEFAPQLNAVETEHQAVEMLRNPEFLTFGINAEDGRLAAIATVQQESDNMVGLGFAVGAEHRRQGYATDIIKTLSENIFKTQAPDIIKIRCIVNPANRKSRLLLLKCGFHLQGEIPHRGVIYDLDKNGPNG